MKYVEDDKQLAAGSGDVVILPKTLNISSCSGTVELKNHSKKEVTVRLKVEGSKAFSIPKKLQQVTIKPKFTKRVPVKFQIDEKNIGWPIALNTTYRAGIQVWGVDLKKKVLLDIISISAEGPALVPFLRCMAHVESEKKEKIGNSPPSISIEAVKPGTSLPKNTGSVELSWEVDGADEIWDVWSHPGLEVLEPGTVTDASGWENYGDVTPSAFTFTSDVRGTVNIKLSARNDDGEVWKNETLYHTALVGYHDARCPAGGTIYTNELDLIRTYLEDIDGRLRANILEDLPSFVEEWNSRLEERLDIPSDVRERYRFPEFDDMDYLTGHVGSGSLADDILAAMSDVLIYVKPHTLPRGYRPGTTTGDEHALCEVWVCTPDERECTVMGKTYYSATHPDCNWIAICLERYADDLTLLHELYHYATGSGNEQRAVAISCCIFDNIPW